MFTKTSRFVYASQQTLISLVIYAVTDYDETIYTKLQGILAMRLRIQMYVE